MQLVSSKITALLPIGLQADTKILQERYTTLCVYKYVVVHVFSAIYHRGVCIYSHKHTYT